MEVAPHHELHHQEGQLAIRDEVDDGDDVRVAERRERHRLALEPTLTVRASEVLSAGSTALVVSDWRMSRGAAGGRAMREPGAGVHVVRRQAGGGWLIVIDHP